MTGDDLWEQCSYVLSVKLTDPQFAGQTKERLLSRQSSIFVSGAAKDAFSLWLNEHPQEGEKIAELVISNAQKRTNAAKKITRKTVTLAPLFPVSYRIAPAKTLINLSYFWLKATLPEDLRSKREIGSFKRFCLER